MTQVLLINADELRSNIALDLATIDCINDAFHLLATKEVVMPDILRMDIKPYNGEVDVKTAFIPGIDSFAIKVSPGFFDNPKIGLPSLNGLMILLSAKTGVLEAMLLDHGYLTAIRTAAAGAVASKYLARTDAHKVAIIGAGEQAGLQLKAVTLVRPITTATVWAPDFNKASAFAAQQTELLNIPVTACQSIAQAIQEADIAVTTTPSTEPLIKPEHLHPGLHITAMGSDAEHKNEIDPRVIASADLYVCDRITQVRKLGELHHAIVAGLVNATDLKPEIGQIIAGQQTGRTNNDQITICDLTGTGVQDTAIATMAYTKALQNKFGSFI